MTILRSRAVRGLTAVLAAAATTALTTSAAQARPTGAVPPPPGAVRVSSDAASAEARVVDVRAASASWVVYGLDGKVYARPSGGGKPVSVATQGATVSLAGDLLLYGDHASRYRNLDTGASGAAPGRWSSSSPDGGVYGAVAKADGQVHGYDQAAVGGGVVDLGALPGMGEGPYVNALADEDGVAFMQQRSDGTNQVDYVAFDDPGHAVALRTDGLGFDECTSLTSNALGCAPYSSDEILRVPLDGSAPQRIAIAYPKPRADVDYVTALAFVTPSHTFWAFDFTTDDDYHGADPSEPLFSVPASSPRAKPASSSFRLTGAYQVVAGGDTVHIARPGRPSTAGVVSMTSADGKSTRFVSAGATPLHAAQVAITVGQAVFVDDSGPHDAQELRVTPLSRAGDSLATGPVRTVGRSPLTVARASDSRILYQPTRGSVAVASTVGDGAAHARWSRKHSQLLALSGSRAVVRDTRRGKQHDLLVDLVSGHVIDLTARSGVSGAKVALFGRYLAFGTTDGSIRRLDLGTFRTTRIAGPTKASRGKRPADIAAWGDYVAWDYFVRRAVNREPIVYTYSSHFRDVRTMSHTRTLPTHDTVQGASADGVALRTVSAETQSTLVRPWTGDATRRVVDRRAFVDSSIALYGISADDPYRSGGTVYAAPLRHAANRPQSLGDPFGATTVRRSGAWRFDLATSAVLTSCHVVLRNAHGAAIRTLPCAQTLMRVGEAAVTWDAKDRAGRTVPSGRYRWTVAASNADGSLLASTGSHAATRGTVTIG